MVAGMGCASTAANPHGAAQAEDPYALFGPLEVGADYATALTRINREPFKSSDHGGRWVNTFVSAQALPLVGQEAAVFAEGTVVVKESFADAAGKPGAVRGPVFVMQKRATGSSPASGDWWFALHWDRSAEGEASLYWRSPSEKVAYCYECHRGWAEHDAVAVGIGRENLAPQVVTGTPAESEEVDVQEVDEEF
jgi:hypothetical protein